MPSSKRLAFLSIAMCATLSMLGAWMALGQPNSVQELLFLARLAAARMSSEANLKLSDLMPTEWETVCESHGYDGPLTLQRYHRTYQPVAPPQDAIWGLIFIKPDGSFTKAVGSCRFPGVQVRIAGGCLASRSANLKQVPDEVGNTACTRYLAK